MASISMPPVLFWSLKRGECEPSQQERFEFPRTMNMGKYVSSAASAEDPEYHYVLYAVLVEYENPAIRYFSFVRPDLEADSGQWYKFGEDIHGVPQSTVFDSSVGGQEWLCVNYL